MTRTDSTLAPGQRHVLITGAGSGIGQATALRLAGDGVALSLLGRTADRLAHTAQQARAAGARAVEVQACDIRERAQVDRAVAAAARALGPLHALVANSGIGGANRPGPDDRFDDLVSTNLTGTYSCLRAAQRHLAPGPQPRHLIVISSILARFGVPGYTGYCATKSGLLGLVRALALELAEDGVRVNALCPGWVETDMARGGIQAIADAQETHYEAALESALSAVPLGRMSEPAEIAAVVAWLLSPDARGITGQGIDVNNGAWMG